MNLWNMKQSDSSHIVVKMKLPSKRSQNESYRLANGGKSKGGTGIKGEYFNMKCKEFPYGCKENYDSSYELQQMKYLSSLRGCKHWT